MKTFQTLFPPLAPKTLKLSSARRVVLISYNPDKGTIDFRHYLITVRPYGVSWKVQKVLEGASAKASSSKHILDLGNEQDVADFLLRKKGEPGPTSDGYESAASTASSVAGDDGDAISLGDDYVGRNNKKGQKRAVRLDEIGPRMELRLIKITEGVPGKEGGVIYHEFGTLSSLDSVPLYSFRHIFLSVVKRTRAENAAQKAEHAAKEKLRKQRREEQERNVRRKKLAEAGDGEDAADDLEDEDASGELEDDGEWDEDEEISEDEGEDEEASGSESSESEDEQKRPPPKKPKKSKR